MSEEDARLESDVLWEKIEAREAEENWCEFDCLTGEFQEYVIALRRERDDAIFLLGTSMGGLVRMLEVLRQWATRHTVLINGSRQQADLVEKTKAVLAEMGGIEDGH